MIITLENYLDKRKKELDKLRKEIAFLSRVNIPLKIEVGDSEFQLFSEDYHLAENFKIKKRSSHLGGYYCPDGGYSTNKYDSYPQFYFNFRRYPVLIQHKGFDNDSRILIKSVTVTEGCKDYASESARINHYIDLPKFFEFFRSKGVKDSLLKRLERRIEEAGEL